MKKPKYKIIRFSKTEWLRISEALGMLVADQSEGTRNYYWDLRLMNKWDLEIRSWPIELKVKK